MSSCQKRPRLSCPFVAAWLRRDAIASYVSFFCSSPHANLECDLRNPCSSPAHPHPCASAISVGDSSAFHISLICAICGRYHLQLDIDSPTDATDYQIYDIGPAPRNPQLILNLLPFVAAWLRRDAIASYVSFFCSSPHANLECDLRNPCSSHAHPHPCASAISVGDIFFL